MYEDEQQEKTATRNWMLEIEKRLFYLFKITDAYGAFQANTKLKKPMRATFADQMGIDRPYIDEVEMHRETLRKLQTGEFRIA